MKKTLSSIFIMLLLLGGISYFPELCDRSMVVEGKTITVNDNGGSYKKIQDAIDNATSGDTIRVWGGTYYENLIINKTITLIGNGTSNTIIDGGNNGTVIRLTADEVTIMMFTIQNSGSYYCGIKLEGRKNNKVTGCTISNNNCKNNGYGIYFQHSNNNNLIKNIVRSNNYDGIFIDSSSNNILKENTVDLNNNNGIYLDSSVNNNLSNNIVITNTIFGIYLEFSFNNILTNNTVNSNGGGIYLDSSLVNILSENIVKLNNHDGISLISSSNNVLTGNTLDSNNRNGISLKLSSYEKPNLNYGAGSGGSGNTYYVSTTGNNSKSGITETAAWRTITYAANQVKAGDTVYIKSGYYGHEHIIIEKSGTKENPIVFQGYKTTPGDKTEPDDMPRLNGSNGTGNAFLMDGKEYITIKNFNIIKYQSAVLAQTCDYLTLDNIYAVDLGNPGFWAYGIWIRFCEYGIINNCYVKNTRGVNYQFSYSHYFLINNCESRSTLVGDPGWKNSTDYYYHIFYSTHFTIQNCLAFNQHAATGGHMGHGFIIRDKTNPSEPYPHSNNNKIINCTAIDLQDAFTVADRVHDNEFIDCTQLMDISNFWGILVYNGAYNNTFTNCTIDTGLHAAVGLFDVDSGYSTKNNIFKNCVFKSDTGMLDFGTSSPQFKGLTEDNIFKNCVFYGNGGYFAGYYGNNNINFIRNCIITNITTFEQRNGTGDVEFTYSCFYNNGFSKPPGTGNIAINPKFVSSTDYHLKSKYGRWNGSEWVYDKVISPCIDAGDPNDIYYHESQPNGGRINMGIYGNTPKESKSFVDGKYGFTDGCSNNIISDNIVINNNYGICLESSINNTIINNTINTNKENGYGIYILDSSNNNFNMNNINTLGEFGHGILIKNSNNTFVFNCKITTKGSKADGFYLDGMVATIKNSIISTTINGYDIIIKNNGDITAMNCSFNKIQLTNDGGGVLRVKNYLDIQVYNGDAITPIIGADVEVNDNDNPIYTSKGYGGIKPTSNTNGRIKDILITDRWYIHSNTATENNTDIKVKKIITNVTWEEIRNSVNLLTSHTETFIASDFVVPSIPIGLKVTRISNLNSLNISWDQNKNTVNYTVYTLKFNQWEILNNVTYPQNWILDENLQDETLYYYKIEAWNKVGWSSAFSEVVYHNLSDITPPSAPTGLSIEPVLGGDALNISWKLNTDDTIEYDVWWKDPLIDDWTLLGKIPHPKNWFIWSNNSLINGTKYYFKVRAWDKITLSSDFSIPTGGIHRDYVPPKSPTNLTAKSISDNTIILNWRPSWVFDVVGYRVFINQSDRGSGGPYEIKDEVDNFSYKINNLSENTTYFFVVTAIDEANNTSPFSEESWNTTLPAPKRPRIITNIPIHNSTNVAVNSTVEITFSIPMKKTSVVNVFTISPFINYNLHWTKNNTMLIISFPDNLKYDTIYTFTIGAAKAITDGNLKDAPFIISFITTVKPTINIISPLAETEVKPSEIIIISGISTGLNEGTQVTVTLAGINETGSISADGAWSVSIKAPDVEGIYIITTRADNQSYSISIIVRFESEIDEDNTDNENKNHLIYIYIFILFLLILIIIIITTVFIKKKRKKGLMEDNEMEQSLIDNTLPTNLNEQLTKEISSSTTILPRKLSKVKSTLKLKSPPREKLPKRESVDTQSPSDEKIEINEKPEEAFNKMELLEGIDLREEKFNTKQKLKQNQIVEVDGEELLEDNLKLQTIVSKENEIFECPNCHTILKAEDNICPQCSIEFEE